MVQYAYGTPANPKPKPQTPRIGGGGRMTSGGMTSSLRGGSGTSYGSNYFGEDEQSGYGQRPGYGSNGGMPDRLGGGASQGNGAFGMSNVGQGQSRYVDPKTGELRTRIGNVNYGAFASIQNMLKTNPQAAEYLRSMGIMPTYNGQSLDTVNGPQRQWSTSPTPASLHAASTGGRGTPATPYWQAVAANPNSPFRIDANGVPQSGNPRGSAAGSGQYTPPQGFNLLGADNPMAGGGAGGFPSFGTGGGGGFGGAGGGLDGQIANAYSGLIGSGGGIGGDLENHEVNSRRGSIDRGTRDAIEQARINAARRGDTSGSTLGDLEARIRARGSADSAEAEYSTRADVRRENMLRLLQSLGGATGFSSGMQRNQLLAGQLAGQSGSEGLRLMLGI